MTDAEPLFIDTNVLIYANVATAPLHEQALNPNLRGLRETKTMTQVSVELPEAVYSVLHCSPSELDKELRLAASAHWYQQGRISQEWAARVAGMDRTDFLLALARMDKDSFVVDFDDLDNELARG